MSAVPVSTERLRYPNFSTKNIGEWMACNSSSEEERLWAATVLAESCDDLGDSVLTELAHDAESVAIRDQAKLIMGEIRADVAPLCACQRKSSIDDWKRASTFEPMVQGIFSKAGRWYAINSENESVRLMAAEILSEQGDPAGFSVLHQLAVGAQNVNVSDSARLFMGKLHDECK